MPDGRCLATRQGVKFVETSAVGGQNVDELLVGVTKQLLLRKQQDRPRQDKVSNISQDNE